ncbi:MAG: ferritin-like domain-containing protein [Gemmatimonadota bacterium]|nr:ferritin-like domain-containing protein [Gemmatimonadota bacterium]
MTAPRDLQGVYTEELRDLWSANDQMQAIVPELSAKARDPKLKEMLEQAIGGIAQHTGMLKSLIQAKGGIEAKDQCMGMEGLVKEAKKHALADDIEDDDVRDVIIIAQYQRMCHYGLAGFGAATAFAKALGLSEDEAKLKHAVSDIYKGDEAATQLAERSVNLAAEHV